MDITITPDHGETLWAATWAQDTEEVLEANNILEAMNVEQPGYGLIVAWAHIRTEVGLSTVPLKAARTPRDLDSIEPSKLLVLISRDREELMVSLKSHVETQSNFR